MNIKEHIDYLNKVLTIENLKKYYIDKSLYKSSKSDSGYKGIYPHRNNTFRVQLVINKERYSLGVYKNLDLAIKKYGLVKKILSGLKIGGIHFSEDIEEKCKKNKDCDYLKKDLKKKEKVKCNRNTGLCEKYMKVENYINEKVDCRKKKNKELAECINNTKIDCRKKKNSTNVKCIKNKPDCRYKKNKQLDICKDLKFFNL